MIFDKTYFKKLYLMKSELKFINIFYLKNYLLFIINMKYGYLHLEYSIELVESYLPQN